MIILCLLLGWLIWYGYYSFECALNGCGSVLRSFLQELSWFSNQRKADYIRKTIEKFDEGAMCSSKGSWTYEEIKEKNLYEEVGKAMLPGKIHFIFTHMIIPLLPLLTYLVIMQIWSKYVQAN